MSFKFKFIKTFMEVNLLNVTHYLTLLLLMVGVYERSIILILLTLGLHFTWSYIETCFIKQVAEESWPIK